MIYLYIITEDIYTWFWQEISYIFKNKRDPESTELLSQNSNSRNKKILETKSIKDF